MRRHGKNPPGLGSPFPAHRGAVPMHPFGVGGPQRPGSFDEAVNGDNTAYWTATKQSLTYASIGGGFSSAALTTPLLDLRAGLGQQGGYEAQAVATEGVLFGLDLDLFLDITLEQYMLLPFLGYRVFITEFGAAVDPALGDIQEVGTAALYSERREVTLAFNQGIEINAGGDFRSILRVTPTGPLRYWGAVLTFEADDFFGIVITYVSGALH